METTHVQQPMLMDINLSDIEVTSSNEIFRNEEAFSEQSLKEITESVRQNGIISPILVRITNNGHYILVAGERRFRASGFAGKKTIPAYIRPMTEEQAFDLQMIENLEREGVHPMKECMGYHHILQKDPKQKPNEIAQRFGKSETYVVQRLKLIDLVPAIQKAFVNNRISLSQALLLARMTPEIQNEYLKQRHWDNSYGTLDDLKRFINQEVIHSLNEALFDTEDADLLSKAGTCTLCPKRSGCSPTLFADVKGKDRCMDHNCFHAKTTAHLIKQITGLIQAGKDTVFIRSYNDPIEEILEVLDENQIKPLKEYNDFGDDKAGTKAKGYWISGSKVGTVSTIYLKAKAKGLDGTEKESTKVEIAKIQQRVKRSAELDGEKVYGKILEAMRKHSNLKATKKMITEEEAFAWFIVYDKAGFNTKRQLDRLLKIPSSPEKAFKCFSTLTSEQKGTMVRLVMMDQYGGNYPTNIYAAILRKVAEAYKDVPISEFEKEQTAIRTKREERAKERIKQAKQKGA